MKPRVEPRLTPTTLPSVTPSAGANGEVPQACVDYDASASADSGPLAVVASDAALPAGMILE